MHTHPHHYSAVPQLYNHRVGAKREGWGEVYLCVCWEVDNDLAEEYVGGRGDLQGNPEPKKGD